MAKLVECITRSHALQHAPMWSYGPIFIPKRKKLKGYQKENKKYNKH